MTQHPHQPTKASKPRQTCARCGQPVPAQKYTWFSHEVEFTEPHAMKSQVIFKVEVRQPRHGKLCLRCLGETIAAGSSAIHAKLVELNTLRSPPA